MINYVWAGLILIAYAFAVFNGRVEAVTQGALDGAKNAVEMILGLLGMMCFWTGLLEIAKRSGLVGKLTVLLRPVTNFLFPDLDRGSPAVQAIVMNMIANILGLSNAATPLGLKAMGELDKLNGGSKIASNPMCMFVVVNTASINLIPATVITLRSAAGSTDPFGIIVPVWISSICAITAGVTMAKISERREYKKSTRRSLCR